MPGEIDASVELSGPQKDPGQVEKAFSPVSQRAHGFVGFLGLFQPGAGLLKKSLVGCQQPQVVGSQRRAGRIAGGAVRLQSLLEKAPAFLVMSLEEGHHA